MGKQGLPEITDRFTHKCVREIKRGELEGKIPGRTTLCIGNGYKINTQGQVIGQNNVPLTPIFRKGKRSPVVIIKLKRKESEGEQKEQRIDNLMEEFFGPYIEGYSEKTLHTTKEYIVVPKDGNWNDMSVGNLRYEVKEEYDLHGTKKELLLQLIPFFTNISDEEIAKLLSTSSGWVRRVKAKLKEKGKIGDKTLNTLIISHKTYQIYVALLACKGLQSNLEIAKGLRPKADFKNKEEQEILTNKVSRVRKKLYEKGCIKKYNTYQKEVNIGDVRKELEKTLIANRAMEKGKRKTHAEIAKAFGLGKEQVDNFSRQITKKENMKIEELELVE